MKFEFSFICWFLFAVWIYLLIFFYFLGFIWFLNRKSIKRKYDFKLLIVQFFFFFISSLIQIWFLIFFYLKKEGINESLVDNIWLSLMISDIIFVVISFIIIFLFSNNFAVKFEKEYLNFLGLTILTTSIIEVKKTKNGNVYIKFVYRKEKRSKWTETIKLHNGFVVTDFFYKNYKLFIDPEKNLAFFDIDKVLKNYNNEDKKNKKN